MSASDQVNGYQRGKSYTSGELPELLGTEKWFDDKNLASTAAIKPLLSGMQVLCRLVKNSGADAALPGQVVKYETGYWGLRTDDEADTGVDGNGVVDEYLPAAGVAAGAHYWLVIKGPTKPISDGNSTLAQGDKIITIGTDSGKCRLQVAAPSDATAAMIQVRNTFGTVMDATVAAVDGTTFRAYVDFTGK